MIKKAAKILKKYEMEVPAILILGSVKPLAYLGGQLGRFFLAPLLPFIGKREDSLIQTFEKSDNIEKLIKMLEEIKKEEKAGKKVDEDAPEEEARKSWWKRFFPF